MFDMDDRIAYWRGKLEGDLDRHIPDRFDDNMRWLYALVVRESGGDEAFRALPRFACTYERSEWWARATWPGEGEPFVSVRHHEAAEAMATVAAIIELRLMRGHLGNPNG